MAFTKNVTLTTAHAIQEQFAKLGRDYFPLPVYEWLANYGNEQETDTELDVVAWCININRMSFKSYLETYLEKEDMQGVVFNKDIEKYISPNHSLIFADMEDKVIYFLDN